MARPERYRWDEPSSVEREGGPATKLGGWTTVVSLEGHWSHCDLWFVGLVAYVGRPFRILGRIGGIWAVLATGAIGVPPLLATNATERTGILASVRGRPCEALLVEVANAVGAVLPPARWRLHAWGRESDTPSTTTGGPAPTIWTPRHSVGPVSVFVASAAPCIVAGALARNDGAGLRWFQIHDTAAAPAANAVPVVPGLPIQVGGPGSISTDAMQMAIGCCLVSSLTAALYTVDPGASLDMGALVQ